MKFDYNPCYSWAPRETFPASTYYSHFSRQAVVCRRSWTKEAKKSYQKFLLTGERPWYMFD